MYPYHRHIKPYGDTDETKPQNEGLHGLGAAVREGVSC